jgi:hypothetical protein
MSDRHVPPGKFSRDLVGICIATQNTCRFLAIIQSENFVINTLQSFGCCDHRENPRILDRPPLVASAGKAKARYRRYRSGYL